MSRWEQKANSLWAGWVIATGGPPPNPNAVYIVLAQAEHETNCGDAWDHSCNWGACNLRALNDAERAAFASGDLKVGMWLYPDGTWGEEHRSNSIGTIRGDSDPNTGAFKVWFFAGPTDAAGAAYMIRAGIRGARRMFDDLACSPETYAQTLYLEECYFGGFHPTAAEAAKGMPHPRVCGKRPLPLNAAEEANVADYANAIRKILPSVTTGLTNWVHPGAYGQVPEAATGEVVGAPDTNPSLPTGHEVRHEPDTGDE